MIHKRKRTNKSNKGGFFWAVTAWEEGQGSDDNQGGH
jgi:hypothetical protein